VALEIATTKDSRRKVVIYKGCSQMPIQTPFAILGTNNILKRWGSLQGVIGEKRQKNWKKLL